MEVKRKGIMLKSLGIIAFFLLSFLSTFLYVDKVHNDHKNMVAICVSDLQCGSGFFIEGNLLVSAYHVFNEDQKGITLIDGTWFKKVEIKEVVKHDKNKDFIAVKLDKYVTHTPFETNKEIKDGIVISLGYPGILQGSRFIAIPGIFLNKYCPLRVEFFNSDPRFKEVCHIGISHLGIDSQIISGMSGGPIIQGNKVVGVLVGRNDNFVLFTPIKEILNQGK